MRALVLRDYGHLVVQDIPDPAPVDGEVLVRIVATGICGSDVHGFTGHNGRREPGQIMGHETVGKVEAAFEGSPLRPGTTVTVNPVIACGACAACQAGHEQICTARRVIGVDPTIQSAFAELMVVPERNVVPLGSDTPTELGALVEPLSVGYHAVVRGGCAGTDRVVVIGGGPIGQACWLAARRLGAVGVVSEPDRHRRALLRRLGAAVVDPARDDVPAAVAEHLGGTATLALDAVGSAASLADALAATQLGGRVVLVGMHDPRLDLAAYALSTEERALVGSFCYSAQDFRDTAIWVSTTDADLTILVEGQVQLGHAPAAFAAAGDGTAGPGKVLVRLA